MSVEDEDVCAFVKQEYDIQVTEMVRLVAYEGINIHLKTGETHSGVKAGYRQFILKILAAADIEFLDLQHRMMFYLHESGMETCVPVPTVGNKLVSSINVSVGDNRKEEATSVLLTYVEGVTLREAGSPDYLLKDVGRLAGKLDNLLIRFETETLQERDTLWELSRVTDLEALLPTFCEESIQKLGHDIFRAYNDDVKPILDTLKKGYIHGDLNDVNIIVKLHNKYTVSGIIDYGDVCVSAYVYEIGTLMADIMSSNTDRDPFNVCKLLLSGYQKEFELNDKELKCLRIVICVRLLQYYVLSADTLAECPENKYAGLDRDGYLHTLKVLWSTSAEEFWTLVIQST